jgi:two-component system, probable response regulator PhcQ
MQVTPVRRLLVVDDEPHVLSSLRRSLRRHFAATLEIETFDDPMAALARSREREFDVVVSDLRMPETDGVSFLTLMAAVQPRAVRMMLTGSADFESAQRAVNDAQVFRYLCKPWQDGELVSHVEAALQQRALAAAAEPQLMPGDR